MLPLRLHRHRPPSRKRQAGFLRLSMLAARWGGSGAFRPQDLFRAGEAGAHFEAYDPTKLLARRNLFTFTQSPANTAWPSTGGATGTDNVATAPDGTQTAGVLIEDTTNASHRRFVPSVNYVVGRTYTFSVYLKKRERHACLAFPSGNFGTGSVSVDLDAGVPTVTTGAVTVGIEPASVTFPNAPAGWYRVRCSAVCTVTGTSTNSVFLNQTANTAGGTAYQGDGVSGVYIWGIQMDESLVAGGTATPYQKVTDWYTEYMAAALESIGMWQDSTGTTPVTAVEQPVGLWMDGKAGKWTRGANIIPDGGFDAGLGAWLDASTAPATVAWSAGVITLTRTDTNNARLDRQLATVPNTWYTVQADIGASAPLALNVGTAQGGATLNASVLNAGGTRYAAFLATSATTWLRFLSQAVGTTTLDNVSIRPVLGNHATQSTSGQRPTLSARYNLLTKTDQLADAAWSKTDMTVTNSAANDGFGAPTLSKLVEGVTTGNHFVSSGSIAIVANAPIVGSATIKAGTKGIAELRLQSTNGAYRVYVNLATGATLVNGVLFGTVWTNMSATVVAEGDGSAYRVTLRGTTSDANPSLLVLSVSAAGNNDSYAGDGASFFYAGKCDLRTADDAAKNIPAYQRVNTPTDYDTDSFPHYLKFDGSDDGLATGAVDFSAFDKVMVLAAIAKLSEVSSGCVVEASANSSITAGSFGLIAPNVGVAGIQFRAAGTVTGQSVGTANGANASPVTLLATGLADISGSSQSLRLANVQQSANVTGIGAGNLTAQPLFIGKRNNASLPFNGRIHSLTVRASSTPASEGFIAKMNRYAANLMAVTI